MKLTFSIFVFILFVSWQISSQTNSSDYIKTKSGLQIKITHEGNGDYPKDGDNVSVHYTGKLLDGTVFDSSVSRGQPFTFELGAGRVIKGWDEGIKYLKKGGKASLIIPSELAYGKRNMGSIPPNSVLIFDVELIDIKPGVRISPYNTAGKDTLKTASGLKYIIIEKGSGKKAIIGGNVTIQYSGWLENGKMFDSSIKKGQPLKFPLGQKSVLPGLDEAVSLMHVGDKIRFIIPPELGFGNKANSVIPANSAALAIASSGVPTASTNPFSNACCPV